MSEHSQSRTDNGSTSNRSIDEPPLSDDSEVANPKSWPPEEGQAQAQAPGPGLRPRTRSDEKRHHTWQRGEAKATWHDAYKDLLNSTIEQAADTVDDDIELLAPSRIGASYWKWEEKAIFFSALAKCGPNDLLALSNAIQTKSEPEVHAYLLLLQQTNLHSSERLSSSADFTFAAVPAAYEIRQECEEALELAAKALARDVTNEDVGLERQEFGDYWLIDEDVAAEIETNVEQVQTAFESDRQVDPNGSEEAPGGGNADVDGQTPPNGNDFWRHNDLLVASASLLRPESFLKLSHSLFMNGAPGTGANWIDIDASDEVSSEPAIFRSAFDDLYNSAITLTRKLVQASLFQAMSRLRANDTWSVPTAQVAKGDVRIAAELLGLDVGWTKYWATAARRLGVEVYGGSTRFRDGRKGTKNGFKLTLEEVEEELGLDAKSSSTSQRSGSEQSVKDAELGGLGVVDQQLDSERPSEETTTDNSDSDSEFGHSSSDWEGSKDSTDPLSDEEIEMDYLEDVDQQASRVEEQRLWKEVLKSRDGHSAETPGDDPVQPRALKRLAQEEPSQWRKRMKYEAEWEHKPGFAQTSATTAMAKAEESERQRGRHHSHRKLSISSLDDESGSAASVTSASGSDTNSDEEMIEGG